MPYVYMRFTFDKRWTCEFTNQFTQLRWKLRRALIGKYSIIVGLSTINSAMNYHVSIFPTRFGGGAVPYKEYSTIEELWEVSKFWDYQQTT